MKTKFITLFAFALALISCSKDDDTPEVIPMQFEYTFNNTLNNTQGNSAFDSKTENYFVNDRDGNANSALYIDNKPTSTTINGLPSSNSERSVSVWVKPDGIAYRSDNVVFFQGDRSANSSYGFSFQDVSINNFGWTNDLTSNTPLTNNTWTHIVCVFDKDALASIYVNGVLITSDTKSDWNTASANNIFILGAFDVDNEDFKGAIDDLKIYRFALTPENVTDLYENNSI